MRSLSERFCKIPGPRARAIPLKDIINNAGRYISPQKMQSILSELEKI